MLTFLDRCNLLRLGSAFTELLRRKVLVLIKQGVNDVVVASIAPEGEVSE